MKPRIPCHYPRRLAPCESFPSAERIQREETRATYGLGSKQRAMTLMALSAMIALVSAGELDVARNQARRP